MAEQTDDPVWKASIREHHSALRNGILVSNVLPALRTLLTDVEYLRVEAKGGDVAGIDELVAILLTKDESTFDAFCSVLEENGYPHWARKLKGEVSSQKSCPLSPQLRAKHARRCHVWHPLENEFERVKNNFLKVLEKQQLPSLSDLKVYCSDRVASVECMQLCVARELEAAQSYEAVVNILFHKLCKWLSFSLLEMILDYFHNPLGEASAQLESYKKQLKTLQQPLIHAEKYLSQAESPPVTMQKVFVHCVMEAKEVTLEDIIAYRQFLSSSLKIPHHLLVLVSVLRDPLLLELWIPEELAPQVVCRVEDVWRKLWERKVEGIEVGDRSFDLLQQSNVEKATLVAQTLALVAAIGPWQGVLSPYGTRLYEEYGRHESLQSCVRKHKEAGHPSPEALGALEWLLLHHTPEEAEREGKDPLDVLLTTVFMGGCDVKSFVRAFALYGRCLDRLSSGSAVENRFHQAAQEYLSARRQMSDVAMDEVITRLPDGAVAKLYLKYCHLPSLQAHISPGVKDPQHLSHEEVERGKKWFGDFVKKLEPTSQSSPLPMILVEAGVTDEGIKPALSVEGGRQTTGRTSYSEGMIELIAKARQLLKMEKSFPHSQEDVRVLQSSFRRYLAFEQTISPDALLQSANSQRRDVYQLFFETLEEQSLDLEPYKFDLREAAPLHYRQDVVRAYTPAGAVAVETSSASKEEQVLAKRDFQLQVAKVFPVVSSASNTTPLSEELARTPLFVEQDSSARLMSAEESVAVAPHLLKLWSWYEVSFLKLAIRVLLGLPALDELDDIVKNIADSLQHASLPECFPHGPLTADQLAPPPGYTPLRLTLPNHPEDVSMGRLWSLKEQLCSSLALQPYALLLKGYMEGIRSIHIIFHISRHVTLDEDQVAAMFARAKRAGLYPHSITTGFSTAQEVEYHLMDTFSLIKMRKVKGQMEGVSVAETERRETTPPPSQEDQ